MILKDALWRGKVPEAVNQRHYNNPSGAFSTRFEPKPMTARCALTDALGFSFAGSPLAREPILALSQGQEDATL
jgi:hypothetical protein